MISIALLNLKKWRSDPIVWTVVFILCIFSFYYYGPIIRFAFDYDQRVSAWIVSSVFSNVNMVTVYVALLGLMFSNAPFYDASSQFSLVRVGRFKWMMGQLLYVTAASFILVAVFWGTSWLVLLPKISFENDWGRIVKSIAITAALPEGYALRIGFPSVVEIFDPINTALLSFCMAWLGSVFVGSLFMFFNYICGKVISFTVFGIWWFFTMVPSYVAFFNWGRFASFLSPFDFMDLFFMGKYAFIEGKPPIWYCLTVLATGIIIFSVVTVIVFCRRDLDAGREE